MRYFDVDRADDPWGGCQDDGNQTQPGGYSCHTYHEDNATMLNVEVDYCLSKIVLHSDSIPFFDFVRTS